MIIIDFFSIKSTEILHVKKSESNEFEEIELLNDSNSKMRELNQLYMFQNHFCF